MTKFVKLYGRQEETLTVGELRALLADLKDDVPVLATWEGIYTRVKFDRFCDGDDEYIEGPFVVFDTDQW